jgi:hypothetical protein
LIVGVVVAREERIGTGGFLVIDTHGQARGTLPFGLFEDIYQYTVLLPHASYIQAVVVSIP